MNRYGEFLEGTTTPYPQRKSVPVLLILDFYSLPLSLSLSLALSFYEFQHRSDPVTSMETQPWHVFRLKLSWQWLSTFNFFPPSLFLSLSFPSPVSYTILFSPDRVSSHGSLPKTCCFLLLHPVTGNLLETGIYCEGNRYFHSTLASSVNVSSLIASLDKLGQLLNEQSELLLYRLW